MFETRQLTFLISTARKEQTQTPHILPFLPYQQFDMHRWRHFACLCFFAHLARQVKKALVYRTIQGTL